MILKTVFKANKHIFKICAQFSENNSEQSNFGYKKVNIEQKQGLVNEVFHSVANKYDLMNDVLSLGIHRCWKSEFVNDLGTLRSTRIQENDQIIEYPARVLDVAGGTDLKIIVFDINESMLEVGKQKAQEKHLSKNEIEFVCGNAEVLPFEDNSFDAYTIAFGIRNVPRIDKALNEAFRVLKKGGRIMILEFSKVQSFPLNEIYKQYNSNILPILGQFIAGDKDSYQYLAESIDKFHDQESLVNLIEQSGFKFVSYKNLSQGICAIHSGFKI